MNFFDIVSGKIPIFLGLEPDLGLEYRKPYQIIKKRKADKQLMKEDIDK